MGQPLLSRMTRCCGTRRALPAIRRTLALERHGARTVAGLRERILARFLCLAACISLNYRLGRPSRALADYCV